ncbi:MAG: radical SAM family heme chaperone HemW [Oscillospiraceae bacterium]|jgi:putative oxygen-independent coproporphyrinogen III oxidase
MEKRLGIYIHIPFCASKCSYCDFYSLAGCNNLMPKYQNALLAHIAESEPSFAPYYLDSIYFGGGTPSYYGARRICEIFNTLKRIGKVLKSAEVTVEVNPDSVSLHDLKLLRKEGVNRLSIGVQSANDDILKLIGRRHNFKQAEKAVSNARKAGFDNISIDLIYGLPSQTKSDWADTLSKALALKPEHISCYGLKLEDGAPMKERYEGSPFLPSDDEQADMYLYTVETLERYGYAQYEISNFCLPGYESRHNLKYWNLEDYMGFGPGAHSCVGNVRYSYKADLKGYISGVNEGKNIIDEYEKVDKMERASEYLMLGLRRVYGISREEYYSIYRSDFDVIEELLWEFEKRGWAKQTAGRWSLTSSGFLLSNILIGALLEAQAKQKMSFNPWTKNPLETPGSETVLSYDARR